MSSTISKFYIMHYTNLGSTAPLDLLKKVRLCLTPLAPQGGQRPRARTLSKEPRAKPPRAKPSWAKPLHKQSPHSKCPLGNEKL